MRTRKILKSTDAMSGGKRREGEAMIVSGRLVEKKRRGKEQQYDNNNDKPRPSC
jgi:hypothetical protein